MKPRSILILLIGLVLGTLIQSSHGQQDAGMVRPCASRWNLNPYFADLDVTETVTRKRLTTSEIMELLDKLPNVKAVTLFVDPPRPFSLDTLAYPQSASRYELTKEEWADLQDYARRLLASDGKLAAPEVVAHWKMIVAGKPPFGLHVK